MCLTKCQIPSASAGNPGNPGPCSICFSKNTRFCIRKNHSNPIISNYFFFFFLRKGLWKGASNGRLKGSLNCIIMWQQHYLIMLFNFERLSFPALKIKSNLSLFQMTLLRNFKPVEPDWILYGFFFSLMWTPAAGTHLRSKSKFYSWDEPNLCLNSPEGPCCSNFFHIRICNFIGMLADFPNNYSKSLLSAP